MSPDQINREHGCMSTEIPVDYQVTHLRPDDFLSNQANHERAWTVRRVAAPFQGRDGQREWFGATMDEALTRAVESLSKAV